ncbi:hypothetical protein DMENIID0001_145050 [Sergentomyia squamirostris]
MDKKSERETPQQWFFLEQLLKQQMTFFLSNGLTLRPRSPSTTSLHLTSSTRGLVGVACCECGENTENLGVQNPNKMHVLIVQQAGARGLLAHSLHPSPSFAHAQNA